MSNKQQQWSLQTERMSVTLVSAPAPVAKQIGGIGGRVMEFEPPLVPTYLLIARPGGGEPVRVEGEDAELLMWMLIKLGAATRRFSPTMMPPGGADFGTIP